MLLEQGFDDDDDDDDDDDAAAAAVPRKWRRSIIFLFLCLYRQGKACACLVIQIVKMVDQMENIEKVGNITKRMSLF